MKYSASAVSCEKLLLNVVKEKRTEMVLILIKSTVVGTRRIQVNC